MKKYIVISLVLGILVGWLVLPKAIHNLPEIFKEHRTENILLNISLSGGLIEGERLLVIVETGVGADDIILYDGFVKLDEYGYAGSFQIKIEKDEMYPIRVELADRGVTSTSAIQFTENIYISIYMFEDIGLFWALSDSPIPVM